MKSVPHPLPAPLAERAYPLSAGRARPVDRPMPGLRLRLKPKSHPTGYVDGGWWPRSRDLSVELPPLIHVLAVRLGRVTTVAYPTEAWDVPSGQITVDGTPVRLDGFDWQELYLLRVTGPNQPPVRLLVIPPLAAATAARQAMMTAAGRGNAGRPVEILAAGGIVPDTTVRRLRLVPDGPQAHRKAT
jgi:Family of unknown function (DUF5994)